VYVCVCEEVQVHNTTLSQSTQLSYIYKYTTHICVCVCDEVQVHNTALSQSCTSQARFLSLQTLIRTLLYQRKHQDLQGMKITINQSLIYVCVCVMKYKYTTQLYHKAGTSQARFLSLQTLIRTLLHQRKHQDLQGMKITINQSSFNQGITPISRLI
jgi:hypothetical protein